MVDQWFYRKNCIIPLARKVLFGKLLDGWECVLVLKISYLIFTVSAISLANSRKTFIKLLDINLSD